MTTLHECLYLAPFQDPCSAEESLEVSIFRGSERLFNEFDIPPLSLTRNLCSCNLYFRSLASCKLPLLGDIFLLFFSQVETNNMPGSDLDPGYIKSLQLKVKFKKLYQAYFPTLLRDLIYGITRHFMTLKLATPGIKLSLGEEGARIFISIMVACLASAPGNELRAYRLQPKKSRLSLGWSQGRAQRRLYYCCLNTLEIQFLSLFFGGEGMGAELVAGTCGFWAKATSRILRIETLPEICNARVIDPSYSNCLRACFGGSGRSAWEVLLTRLDSWWSVPISWQFPVVGIETKNLHHHLWATGKRNTFVVFHLFPR